MFGLVNRALMVTYLGIGIAVLAGSAAFTGRGNLGLIGLIAYFACDLLDGFLARRDTQSPAQKRFGVAVDGLADTIGYGVIPVLVGFGAGLTTWWGVVAASGYVIALVHRLAFFAATPASGAGFTGLPAAYSALALPLVWLVLHQTSWFSAGYAVFLLVLGGGYVLNVPVPKPAPRWYPALLGLAVLLVAALWWLG